MCGVIATAPTVVRNSVWPSGVGLRHEVGADRAVGAGLVLDDDGLAEDVLDLVGDQAADEIGRAAGREGDHHADRAVGEVLRLHGGRGRGEQQQGGGEAWQGVTCTCILPRICPVFGGSLALPVYRGCGERLVASP